MMSRLTVFVLVIAIMACSVALAYQGRHIYQKKSVDISSTALSETFSQARDADLVAVFVTFANPITAATMEVSVDSVWPDGTVRRLGAATLLAGEQKFSFRDDGYSLDGDPTNQGAYEKIKVSTSAADAANGVSVEVKYKTILK